MVANVRVLKGLVPWENTLHPISIPAIHSGEHWSSSGERRAELARRGSQASTSTRRGLSPAWGQLGHEHGPSRRSILRPRASLSTPHPPVTDARLLWDGCLSGEDAPLRPGQGSEKSPAALLRQPGGWGGKHRHPGVGHIQSCVPGSAVLSLQDHSGCAISARWDIFRTGSHRAGQKPPPPLASILTLEEKHLQVVLF